MNTDKFNINFMIASLMLAYDGQATVLYRFAELKPKSCVKRVLCHE